MTIALLFGCSGSGKGHIVEHLSAAHQLISIDAVRRDVLTPLRPLLIGDEPNRWQIWDALIPNFDVVPAFSRTLGELYPHLDSKTPILAEGGLLAHIGFRLAFLSSLVRLGLDLRSQRSFWIDPEPAEVLQHRQARSANRAADRRIAIEDVETNVHWYRSIASHLNCQRFADASGVVAAIDGFLSDAELE